MPESATDRQPCGPLADSLAKAEALCHAVAGRDLQGSPFYLLAQSSLPRDFIWDDHGYGFTSPSLDIYLAPYIPNYRGRGPCVVINDVTIAEDYEAEDVEYRMLTLAIHELAHVLDRPALYADRSGESPEKLQFEALMAADVVKQPRDTDLPAYFGHGASFIRIALHLCHRAALVGVPIGPGAICAGYTYGLSVAMRYQKALGDEPARCTEMLFRDITAVPPPAAFTELWVHDQRWYQERLSQSQEVSHEHV